MTHITSANNPRLRSLRRLRDKRERERSQRFLVEGEDLIAAAEAAGARMLAGYRLAGSGIGGEDFIDVEAAPLRSAGVLSSGARVIGVYEQRWSAPSGPLCVYLHGVSDPGNVGAVLRSAEAFAASCVALGAGCDRRARIPIASHSLNAAMAATIALYELSRASSQGQRSSRVRAR